MEYKIIVTTGHKELTEKLNKYAEDGWTVHTFNEGATNYSSWYSALLVKI